MKTRDRIIHSATELFNDQGERNITTNHIAAHLGISPGNLYYHFRNKEDIIHSIFDQYARHLSDSFTPIRSSAIRLEDLMGYLDAIFYLMWQFRFFYANLPDILSRDELLQQKYLKAQEQLRATVETLLRSLREGGIIAVSDEDLPDPVPDCPGPGHPHHQTPALPGGLAGAVFAAPLRAATGGPPDTSTGATLSPTGPTSRVRSVSQLLIISIKI
jgi:AcrR family transcriptional regulator